MIRVPVFFRAPHAEQCHSRQHYDSEERPTGGLATFLNISTRKLLALTPCRMLNLKADLAETPWIQLLTTSSSRAHVNMEATIVNHGRDVSGFID